MLDQMPPLTPVDTRIPRVSASKDGELRCLTHGLGGLSREGLRVKHLTVLGPAFRRISGYWLHLSPRKIAMAYRPSGRSALLATPPLPGVGEGYASTRPGGPGPRD